jgi:hypothetical protein
MAKIDEKGICAGFRVKQYLALSLKWRSSPKAIAAWLGETEWL